MAALVSVLIGLATALGVWCAASVVALPILVLCVRSQVRANARMTAQMQREDWLAAMRS